MPTDRLFLLCTILLAACLVLGGGTRTGFLSDAAIQLLAIPLLLIAAWRLAGVPSLKGGRWALVLCLAIALVPALQLIPLPPSVWTALPGREPAMEAFRLLGQELPWMPLSLSPRATWLSGLSLLPPIAIFLATLLIGYRERRTLSLILVAFGVLSAFVGLAQVAEGPSSSLRFFAVTNTSEAVGFFANRNHFAAALYAFTVFAAAWAVEVAAPPPSGQTRLDTRWIVPVVASLTVLVILVAAQAMARSRAGLGFTIAALVGAAVHRPARPAQRARHHACQAAARNRDGRRHLCGTVYLGSHIGQVRRRPHDRRPAAARPPHLGDRPALYAVRLGHGHLHARLRPAGAGCGCDAGYLRQPRAQRFA